MKLKQAIEEYMKQLKIDGKPKTGSSAQVDPDAALNDARNRQKDKLGVK